MHTYTSLLLITAILLATIFGAVPAIALTSSTGEFATFRHNAQHTGDYRPATGNSTSNGLLNWRYATNDYEISSTIANGIVYVGSNDSNVYALGKP